MIRQLLADTGYHVDGSLSTQRHGGAPRKQGLTEKQWAEQKECVGLSQSIRGMESVVLVRSYKSSFSKPVPKHFSVLALMPSQFKRKIKIKNKNKTEGLEVLAFWFLISCYVYCFLKFFSQSAHAHSSSQGPISFSEYRNFLLERHLALYASAARHEPC